MVAEPPNEATPVHVHHVFALDQSTPAGAEFGSFGFGAFVRGSAALWHAVQGIANCTLDVCVGKHPTLSRLLKPCDPDACASLQNGEPIYYVDGSSIARLRQHIRRMRAAGRTTIFITTDATPEGSPDGWPDALDPACAAWLRAQFVPNTELAEALAAAQGARASGSFEVLHVRTACSTGTDGPNKLTDLERFVLGQFIETHVCREGAPEIVMISDNADVCAETAPKYGFTTVTGAQPLHLGALRQLKEDVMADATYTLVQFFLMGRAARIFQMSTLSFGTAYSDAAALMHGVPVTRCARYCQAKE